MKYLVWSLVLASWVGKAAVEAYGYCSFDIDDLNRTLHDHVKEQEVAVRTVVEKVGNWDEAGRAVPLVLYFNGPTGVGKTHTTNVLAQYLAGHKDKATFESFAAVDNIIRVPIHPDLDCHDTMALLERRLRTIIERNNDKKSCVKVVIFDEVDVLLEGPQTAATHRECKEGGVSLHADSTPLGKPKACHSPCTCKPDDAYFNFYSILKQLKSVNMMNLFDHSRAGIMGELVRLDNLIVILTGGQSIAEQRELLATHYCQDQHLADVTCRQQLMTSSFEQQQEVGAAVMGPRVKAVFREEYSDMVLGGGHSGGRDSTYSGLVPFFYFFQEELKGVAKHLIDEYMTPFYVKELGLASLTVDDSVLLNIVSRSNMELGARDVKRKVQSCVGNFLWGLATGGMTRADLLDATVTLRLAETTAQETMRLQAEILHEPPPDYRFKRIVKYADSSYSLDDCTNPGMVELDFSADVALDDLTEQPGTSFKPFPISPKAMDAAGCDGGAGGVGSACSPPISYDGLVGAFGTVFALPIFKAAPKKVKTPIEHFVNRSIEPWMWKTQTRRQIYERSAFSVVIGGEPRSRNEFFHTVVDTLKGSFATGVGSIDLTAYPVGWDFTRVFRCKVAALLKRCRCHGDDDEAFCIIAVNVPPMSEDTWRHAILPVLDTTSPTVELDQDEVISTSKVIFLLSMDYELSQWGDFCDQLHYRGVSTPPAPGTLYDAEPGMGALRGRINEIWSLDDSFSEACKYAY